MNELYAATAALGGLMLVVSLIGMATVDRDQLQLWLVRINTGLGLAMFGVVVVMIGWLVKHG